MDRRLGLFIILLWITGGICVARRIEEAELSSKTAEISNFPHYSSTKNNQVCQLCKQLASNAYEYLSSNTTRTEIIAALFESCSHLGSLQKKCTALVDYYAPLFFTEMESIEPETFCEKVNLCEERVQLFEMKESKCDVCNKAVAEVMEKLNDPDMEVEVIEVLLKACKSMKSYTAKCKKMVFEYGPIILANAQKLLEKTDICVMLGACPPHLDAVA